MSSDDLFPRRVTRLAREDPARAIVQLWLHLRHQGNLEQGFERAACKSQAEQGLRTLKNGGDLPPLHPAAALRAVDSYLAFLDSGRETRTRRVDEKTPEADAFWLVPRRAGWSSRIANSQAGHVEFWLRHHQVVPVNHRGIRIHLTQPPRSLRKPRDEMLFLAGGFIDGVLPLWNNASPYHCLVLTNPNERWQSVESLLTTAAERGASIVVLPELTVDAEVRERLCAWLRQKRQRSPFDLVVAGSFHEESDDSRRNVAYIFDDFGNEFFRHVKLRPMRAMPGGHTVDEKINGSAEVSLIQAWFGLIGVAICLDFCESGDTPVTDLWRAAGPALMLVPSMGADATNHAHDEKARALALQHGTATVVASQHPEAREALGLFWDSNGALTKARPALEGVLRWTKP